MKTRIEKQSDYIDFISDTAGLSKVEATQLFNGLKEGIVNALQAGGTPTIFGLGTMSVKHRAARVGRNPKTGEPLQIAAANVPGFKAGKALKDAVNSGQVVSE